MWEGNPDESSKTFSQHILMPLITILSNKGEIKDDVIEIGPNSSKCAALQEEKNQIRKTSIIVISV